MEHVRGGAGEEAQQRSDTFTGAVYADRALSASGVGVSNVLFTPGARTYWHSHGGGQLLSVMHGRGLVANRDGEAVLIEGSDIVWAPGGEEHWHGAAPESFMLHRSTALGQTVWLEEVSEDDYRAAVERALGGRG